MLVINQCLTFFLLGRAGKSGMAITFLTPSDAPLFSKHMLIEPSCSTCPPNHNNRLRLNRVQHGFPEIQRGVSSLGVLSFFVQILMCRTIFQIVSTVGGFGPE
ncbi:unnamed protein product [Auanema sp. JU1783]|nr:unnamed protein product [Auanema sp. JU1783]